MINSSFLNSTGYGWSIAELQNLEYSFLTSLPAYFKANIPLYGVHHLTFALGTAFVFTSAQKNLVTNFVNSTGYDYQISFMDVIDVNISEDVNGSGDITFLNQNKITPMSGSEAYPVNTLNKLSGNAGDIFIDSTDFNNTDLTLGKYGYWNLIHEMGHAIGGLDDFAGKTEE